jgi:glutamate--cysteine ligase catalytic subunit
MRWKPPVLEVGLRNAQQRQEALRDDEVSSSSASKAEKQHLRAALQEAGPGWRTEFRTLEVQLTDFENAAFAALVVILSKTILARGYNFMIPMSYVHENMRRAQKKDAVLTQKFWFSANSARQLMSDADQSKTKSVADRHHYHIPERKDIDLVEMTLDEIMNGVASAGGDGCEKFAGLLQLVRSFAENDLQTAPARGGGVSIRDSVSSLQPPRDVHQELESYLALLGARASGALPTAARWMRSYVTRHPEYLRGSGRLTPEVADDLLWACEAIGMGDVLCPDLYGEGGARSIELCRKHEGDCPRERGDMADLNPPPCEGAKLLDLGEASRKNRSSCISNCP